MATTASEARKNLSPLIEKVNDGRTPIEIHSRRGDAVLLFRAEYDALEETGRDGSTRNTGSSTLSTTSSFCRPASPTSDPHGYAAGPRSGRCESCDEANA